MALATPYLMKILYAAECSFIRLHGFFKLLCLWCKQGCSGAGTYGNDVPTPVSRFALK